MSLRGPITIAVITAFLTIFATPAIADPVNVVGSWLHQETDFAVKGQSNGGNADGGFSGVYDDFTAEDVDGGFTGKESEHGDFESGTVSGSTVSYYTQYAGNPTPFKEIYVGTLSGDDQVITGYGAQCTAEGTAFQVATFTMSLPGVSDPPTPPLVYPDDAAALCAQVGSGSGSGPDATTISLTCPRGPAATDSAVCTAQVSDIAASPTTPTGQVDFSVAAGQGSLPDGSSCTLAPASGAAPGAPASCEITYAPPAAGLAPTDPVPMSAQYEGDATHGPSSIDQGTSQPTGTTTTTTTIILTGTGSATTTSTTTTPVTTTTGTPTGTTSTGPSTPPAVTVTQEICASGPPVSDIVVCGMLAATAIGDSSGYGPDTLPGSLAALYDGDRFVHTFPLYEDTGAGWVEVYAQVQGYLAGQGVAQSTAAHDPPEAGYETLAKVVTPHLPTARVTGTPAQRRAARTINRWLKRIARARGLAAAFTTSVDRAGGAAAAGDSHQQGVQIRYAITLSGALAAQDSSLVPLTGRVAALAGASPQAHRRLPATKLARLRTQLAKRGLTTAQRRLLIRLGDGPAEIADLLAAARDGNLTLASLLTSPAAGLSDPRLADQERSLALYFTLWPHFPSVVTAAAG